MNTSRSTSPVLAALSALALLGTVALTGCSATDLAGPETTPPETVEGAVAQPPASASATGGDDNNQAGGGTETTASHNTLPEDD